MSPTFTREEIVYWLGVVAGVGAGYHDDEDVCSALARVVRHDPLNVEVERSTLLHECALLVKNARDRPSLHDAYSTRKLLTIRALLRAELARRMGR